MNAIKRFTLWLLPAHLHDPLTRLLLAWRLWLVGALLGALLAGLLYLLFPPAYRARATLIVDHNLEDAWQYFPDRQLFFFLERETRKLEELAWSDTVLERVASQDLLPVRALPVQALRAGVLSLTHSRDGAWHFLAQHQDPAVAQSLASAWALAFLEQVKENIAVSPELEAARAALNAEARSPQPDAMRLTVLMEQLTEAYHAASGVSPFVTVTPAQAEDLPVSRAFSLSTALFLGAAVSVLGFALLALFFLRDRQAGDLLA